MKYSETKKIINESFKSKLKVHSFKKVKYGFEKIKGQCYYRCGISVFDYQDYQQATFIFSVGIIPLAKIVIAIAGKEYKPSEIKPSHYPLSQAGLYDDKIIDNPDFTIFNESHIENMVNAVMEFMEKRGFAMLEAKSTLNLLEKHINIELPHNQNNKSNGLILAKLLNRDYYHELVYKYSEIVDSWEVEQYKLDFYNVIEFLKIHTREELMEIGGLSEEDLRT